MPRPAEVREPDRIALVLIHGIGPVTPGDVLASATRAIRKHLDGEVTASEPEPLALRTASGQPGRAAVRRAVLRVGGRRLDLVEFNWTEVLGKIRLRRPFDALRKILGVVRDVPVLGAVGRASRADRVVLTGYAWICQAAVVLALAGALAFFVHEAPRLPEYARAVLARDTKPPSTVVTLRDDVFVATFLAQPPEFPRTAGRVGVVLLCAFIVPYSIVMLYAVARLIVKPRPRRALLFVMTSTLGSSVTTLVGETLVGGVYGVFLTAMFFFAPADSRIQNLLAIPFMLALAIWLPARLATFVGNLARDVAHYLAPHRSGGLQPHQRAIRTELWRLVRHLRDEHGVRRFVLVAHSLGTVIVTDLLLEQAELPPDGPFVTFDIVTAGSPLRRFIRRFFPDRQPDLRLVREILANTPGFRVVRWFNAYRIFDYVGQALGRSALVPDLVGVRWDRRQPDTSIHEHLLVPRFRWPFGHANYWGDPRFLRFMVGEVVAPALAEAAREDAVV